MKFLPRSRGGLLWRAFVGAFLVVGFAAGATAVAGLLQVDNLVVKIHKAATVIHHLTLPKPGQPETILVIGSDHRAHTSYTSANTDTMLLIHLDDNSQTINVMSVPRDLEVLGPGESQIKLNGIYSEEGGPSGLVAALRQQVFGPTFQVNHVVDVNFTGFSDLVNAIGCVYADIDHRYYNVSQPAPSADNYSSIDIQPGYQRLCGGGYSVAGTGALSFVRFRHTDSDEVRNARQQDFIRWARDNYDTSELLNNEGKLISIFSSHATVDKDLDTEDGMLDLFNLLLDANSLSLKTVQFPEYFGACGGVDSATPCYVYPCPDLATCNGYGGPNPPIGQPTEATEAAWKEFITPTKAKPKVTVATTTAPRKRIKRVLNVSGLTADIADGNSQAAALGNVGLPIYYPRDIYTGGNAVSDTYCFAETGDCDNPAEDSSAYIGSYPRRYVIFGPDRTPYKSYVMTLQVNSALGEFYTVQGTTWKDPPLLKKPSRVYRLKGRKLYEFDDGAKIATVAFYTNRGTYWIENTLDNAIPNTQMVAMAAEMVPYK